MPRETPVERFDALLTEYESWINWVFNYCGAVTNQRPSQEQFFKGLAYMQIARPKYFRHQALLAGEPMHKPLREYSQTVNALRKTEERRIHGAEPRFETREEAERRLEREATLERSLHIKEEEVVLPVELEVDLCASPQEGMLKHKQLRDNATDPTKAAHHQAVMDRLLQIENENARKQADII